MVDAGYPNRPGYWHHSRVQDIMFQILGGVLLQVVSMNTLTICIQVFAMR
jgi:hypothetical protein